jgi:hypothetical protein
MINLPAWKLTLCAPLYDTSSTSPIEQTAQVYAKMRELVEEFNKLSENLSKSLEDYIVKDIRDMEEFKEYINCIMQEYIESVDQKLTDLDIEFKSVIAEVVNGAITNETIKVEEVYDEQTEGLVLKLTGGIE